MRTLQLRTSHWLIVITGAVLLAAGLHAQQPPSKVKPSAAQPSKSPAAAQRFTTVGSIRELMQGIIDPAGDALWGAVGFHITQTGSDEAMPKTDADWAAVRRNALTLVEATNLLKIPGRRVAPVKPIPGTESEPAGPEDLTPAQIQVRIDKDRAAFNQQAQGLADAVMVALRAVDARNVDDLFEAGNGIDTACENCHLKYWYPNGAQDKAVVSLRKKN